MTTQLQPVWDKHFHSASTRHPVFFTERLRRSPVLTGPSMANSPVAHGYAYQDALRKEGTSVPKL